MATSITIPTLNGDGSKFALTLNLPPSFLGYNSGSVVWTNTTHATGLQSPSNDARSSLYTVQAAGTDLAVATVTTGPAGLTTPWQPGRLYRLNDEIIDQFGHVQKVTAALKYIYQPYTPEAGFIPQGGDAAYFAGEAARKAAGNYSDPTGLATVLNQGDGDINGDWPAGGLNDGGYGPKVLTTAAPVVLTPAGYSKGRNVAGQDNQPAGISDSNVQGYFDAQGNFHEVGLSFNPTVQQIAVYAEIGANGLISYYDAAGNIHTGWVVATGTQNYSDTSALPPVFSITGGSVLDGDLTWTDQGAAGSTSFVSINITTVAGASAPYGYYALLG